MVIWVFFHLKHGLNNKYVSIWPQIQKSNINSFENLNAYLMTSETRPRARYVCWVYNSFAKYLEGEENTRLASFLVYGVFLQCNISMPAHLILLEETNHPSSWH